MRPLWVLVCLSTASATAAAAGQNPRVLLPLHARISATGSCTQFAPVDCRSVWPTVDVPPSTDIVVYLMVYEYAAVAGVQTAFDWDPSWVLNDVLFDCRVGQVNARLPAPGQPGGPVTGTATTAFTCGTVLRSPPSAGSTSPAAPRAA